MNFSLSLALITLFSSFSAFAADLPSGGAEQSLITLTSDKNSNVYELGVVLDSQNQLAGMFNAFANDPNVKDQTNFTLGDIENSHGVVLLASGNKNALLLNGTYDNTKQTGRFTVKYLENGITMKYLSCDFLLSHPNGAWAVQNAYSGILVKSINVLAGLIGISTIQGLCPAGTEEMAAADYAIFNQQLGGF